MRVVLVGPELEENLALRYLVAALGKAGHEGAIVPFNRAPDGDTVVRRVLRLRPGLVGLSLTAQRRYPEFRSLAGRLRVRGYRGHLVAGGHFASLRALEILQDVPELDSIVLHEGEERIVALADALAATGRPPASPDGLAWRDGRVLRLCAPRRVADIDTLAMPAHGRLSRPLKVPVAPLVASRGCGGACSFCSIHAWHRQVPTPSRVRLRSPSSVVTEMLALHERSGARAFIFHDDDFLPADPGAARERCRAIFGPVERAIGPFAFVLKCRPDHVDADLFAYLKSRGLARVFLGIESHALSGLRSLNRRVTPETNLCALETLRRLGVYACFNLLLFHPDSTLDEVEENLAFLAGQQHHPFDVGRTELYAHSGLERRLLRQGRALGDWRGYEYRIADPRAETAFRLFVEVLWDRHFGAGPLLHQVQDLGFRHGLLRRFHPDAASPELAARVGELIADVNADTVNWVSRLVAAARLADGDLESAWRLAGADDLRREIAGRTRRQAARRAALAFELECRAAAARAGWTGTPLLAGTPRLLGRLAAAAPLLALAAAGLSCSSETVCDPVPPPFFRTYVAPKLAASCATDECHHGPEPASGLDLSEGASYANLVNVPSREVPRLKRVAPGAPDSSYIMIKLRGTQAQVGGSGVQMPPGSEPDTTLVDGVQTWIERGAGEK